MTNGSGSRPRFLVVDDLGVGRSVLGAMLSRFGEVEMADSGQAALELYGRTIEAGESFDLALLDIMMPGMDGITLLEKMREYERARGIPEVRVVMTTATDLAEYVYAARAAGALGYLIKPLDISKVQDLLAQLEIVG